MTQGAYANALRIYHWPRVRGCYTHTTPHAYTYTHVRTRYIYTQAYCTYSHTPYSTHVPHYDNTHPHRDTSPTGVLSIHCHCTYTQALLSSPHNRTVRLRTSNSRRGLNFAVDDTHALPKSVTIVLVGPYYYIYITSRFRRYLRRSLAPRLSFY